MRNPFTQIRHSLSLRLGLWIMSFAVIIFVVSLGFMYLRSREYVRQDAMHRAKQVLNNTALSITEILNEVEIATNNTEWLVRTHTNPDSVRVYSRRIIEMNPRFKGCSIAFEPYYFPEQGEYFSMYSGYSEGIDMIETEQEGSKDYNYFDMDWYTKPRQRKTPCWVDPFCDVYLDDVYVKEMITSYSKPLFDKDERFIGVISTDISLQWLSKTVMNRKPSERSYFFMLGKEGNYFVHPDSTKLVFKTIFSDRDPDHDADIIALGYDMMKGHEGMRLLHLDDEDCYVFYKHLPQTGWSLAVVYPESEIFRGYNRLYYIVIVIIVIGLLLMLFLCRHIINGAIVPVNRLARQARRVAAGNFDEPMEKSDRLDAVGQLQNGFGLMQQFIAKYINDIKEVNAEIEKRNEDLVIANEQAQKALESKTAFMQDVTHQVRTPLNILIGFSQVIRTDHHSVPDEEMEMILDAMQENSQNIKGIINKLLMASYFENTTSLTCEDTILCNELCQQVLAMLKVKCPDTVTLHFETSVPDSFSIRSNRDMVAKILKQMLDNANQFTKSGTIILSCQANDDQTVRFAVTDTGIGIAPEDQSRIFIQFTKLDYFSEGLGLGLALCRRGTELLGGQFDLDKTYQDGARFVLTLRKN